MDTAICRTCALSLDGSDNFCRHCGAAVGVALPAVREPASLTVWRPQLSPVVKGAAVMAAGTVGQFVFRRLVSGLLGGGRNAGRRPSSPRRARPHDDMVDGAQIVTEMVMMRRVRIRRQP